MSAYVLFRNLRLAGETVPGPVINNTGNSRQVRRARARQYDNPTLSSQLTSKLAQMHPGQGLFMQYTPGYGVSRFPGWPNERRKPRRDYSQRYSTLFPVLPDAPDV